MFSEFYTNIFEAWQDHATTGNTTAAPRNFLQQSRQDGSPRSLGYANISISWQQVAKSRSVHLSGDRLQTYCK
jgi:hypothetical protein